MNAENEAAECHFSLTSPWCLLKHSLLFHSRILTIELSWRALILGSEPGTFAAEFLPS